MPRMGSNFLGRSCGASSSLSALRSRRLLVVGAAPIPVPWPSLSAFVHSDGCICPFFAVTDLSRPHPPGPACHALCPVVPVVRLGPSIIPRWRFLAMLQSEQGPHGVNIQHPRPQIDLQPQSIAASVDVLCPTPILMSAVILSLISRFLSESVHIFSAYSMCMRHSCSFRPQQFPPLCVALPVIEDTSEPAQVLYLLPSTMRPLDGPLRFRIPIAFSTR